MIPKNIHLIFLRKDEPFPELFEKCKQEIQVNHPDWNIRLYNKVYLNTSKPIMHSITMYKKQTS